MIKSADEQLGFLANACVHFDKESLELHHRAIEYNVAHKNVKNSDHKTLWDMRYNKIAKYCEKVGLISIPIKRGSLWTAIGVYNPTTEELFLIFTDKNIKKIMKNKKRKHYLALLSIINKEDGKNEQLELFGQDNNEEQFLLNLLDDLLEDIEVKPEKVIACGFSLGDVKTFKAYMFNGQQNLVFEKDYSELIEVDYNNQISSDDIDPELDKEKKHVHSGKLKKSSRIKGLKK
ncbi:DUF5986 family protein [Salinicoccus roseus]|uniref:DUF5986 family protein n=1 Tax=Salinicoccus roseus TaxID=45670 RepID=UPI0023001EE4|nr:DUF5986 family protein [Salinicoccus roseus]